MCSIVTWDCGSELPLEAVDVFLKECQDYSRKEVMSGEIPRHHPVLVKIVEKMGPESRFEVMGFPDPDIKYVYDIRTDSDRGYEYIESNEGWLLLARCLQHVTDPKLREDVKMHLSRVICFNMNGQMTNQDLIDMPKYIKDVFYDSEELYQKDLKVWDIPESSE